VLIEGRTGPTLASDGSLTPVRLSRQGGQVVTDAHGHFYEAAVRSQMFSGFLGATTTGIAAGNLVGAGAAASTQFALWNPVGSGKNVSVVKVGISPISGTFGVNGLVHGLFNATALSITGTSGQGHYASQGTSSVARYLGSAAGSALTGGIAPVNLRLMDFAFNAAAYASAQPSRAIEMVDGEIVLPRVGAGCLSGVLLVRLSSMPTALRGKRSQLKVALKLAVVRTNDTTNEVQAVLLEYDLHGSLGEEMFNRSRFGSKKRLSKRAQESLVEIERQLKDATSSIT
jgi:hypothetical protein